MSDSEILHASVVAKMDDKAHAARIRSALLSLHTAIRDARDAGLTVGISSLDWLGKRAPHWQTDTALTNAVTISRNL